MSKVKIKILLTDSLGEKQTETLADCGFSAGDVVLADLYKGGCATVDSKDFEKATWGHGLINLDAKEFEVIE